ncbi:4Fe-4S binding protein, partial [Candidatus Fermentibacterales bacterium]|nr:4Fe-4S binding protein [Candidatus Fermentibacterales bacterium]
MATRPRGPRARPLRRAVQLASLVAANLHLSGWVNGSIYTGASKAFCIPGLHCYSCPSSVLACPLGSMQSLLSGRGFVAGITSLSPAFLIFVGVLGFVMLPGFVAGRIACAYVCPFGLLQELLFRLTGRLELRPPPTLSRARFVFLGLFVLVLPLLSCPGQGEQWFCKVVCPAGTALAGWPLVALNGPAVFSLGFLFAWKSAAAVAFLCWSAVTRRAFCRFVCPLGAIWGLAGRISVYRISVDEDLCIACGRCGEVCPMGVRIDLTPESTQCIRCGECIPACPVS